jgi:hypothetical protein
MKLSTRSNSTAVKADGILSADILAKLSKNPKLIHAISEMFTPGLVNEAQPPPASRESTTTPGPWKFKSSGMLVNKTGDTIGTFHGAQKAGRQGYKNRNLIKMAPELLALVTKLAEGPINDTLANEARTLVEKAQP